MQGTRLTMQRNLSQLSSTPHQPTQNLAYILRHMYAFVDSIPASAYVRVESGLLLAREITTYGANKKKKL